MDWDEGLKWENGRWGTKKMGMVCGILGRRTIFKLNGDGLVGAFHEKSEMVVSVRG